MILLDVEPVLNNEVSDKVRSSNGKQHVAATMSDSGSGLKAPNHFDQNPNSHAFRPASESSEKSSAYSDDHSWSRGRPRKRKTTKISTSLQPRLKRLKPSHNDDYRELYNSIVRETSSNTSSEKSSLLQESRIGVTVWSSEEKEAFFRALGRRGRQDTRGIATDVGSKSEFETFLYSDMLYKAAVGQHINGSRKNLLDPSNLEAAFEVHGDCCGALDLAAGALSDLQQNEVETAERTRHGDLAVLTPNIARWVERCIVAPEGGKGELLLQIPAARLLNLKNFLVLSKRFFMNSIIPEDNWRSYTGKKTKSPSIMYTAFSDFHALSLSMTQRLVQCSLFFAMSRLRAMPTSRHYTPRSHVRRQDVMAALNVLGMKTDAKEFWATAARNCKLRVYDKIRHRQVLGERYSYVEVESILSPRMISDPDDQEVTAKDANTSTLQKGQTLTKSLSSASEDSLLSDSMSTEVDGSSALSNDENLSAMASDPANEQDHEHEGNDQLEDAYADALDQQTSRNEEHRLWDMLGEDSAEKMELVDVKLPKGPPQTRKDKEELLDWRVWVDYVGDWEMHETPVPESSFMNHPGLKKDDDPSAELTSSDSGPATLINDACTPKKSMT